MKKVSFNNLKLNPEDLLKKEELKGIYGAGYADNCPQAGTFHCWKAGTYYGCLTTFCCNAAPFAPYPYC